MDINKENLEISKTLSLWRYWMYRAFVNYSLRYRQARLGMVWPILSLMAVVIVIGLVWGVLLNKENHLEYFLYLLCGYPVWGLISGAVEQGCKDASLKTSGGIPTFSIILERVVSVFLPFFYVLPIILIGSIWFNLQNSAFLFLFPFVLLLMVVWTTGVISLLTSLVSIFPDIKHLLSAVMKLAFLATPIIWEVGRLGEYQKYIWFNPFYVPLEAVRSSLSGVSVDGGSIYLYFLGSSVLLFSLGMMFLRIRIDSISR